MRIADAITAFFFRHGLRGQTRVHRVLLRGRRIAARTKHGVLLYLDPYEYVDGFVLRDGFYEEEVLNAALARLRPTEVFWDVGANLGLHALSIKRLRPDVVVSAFEPNPSMAALLHGAARGNALEVDIWEVALHSEAGRAPFYIHAGNAGRSGLHNWDSDPALCCVEVETRTADETVDAGEARQPNVIKLDVEGNEDRVLEGMKRTLANWNLHTVIFEDAIEPTSKVKTILLEAGFTIRQLKRQGSTHHNLENFVAVRGAPTVA